MIYLIEEATNTTKIFKCPFCNFRATKPGLVVHIEDEHDDMIPEGYTAARVLFNFFNKKDHGTCVVDGKETEWDEENWRYKRYCCKECEKKYVEEFKKVRMVNKYGVEHLLNDAKQQQKMLSGRSISGEYKFKDGGIRTYCGSYEQKLLEFYDKVLNVPSDDILTPGPVFEYEYNGKKLQWITDVYYLPMNLIHDVKDGGDNPNNREMKDYREKQDAKEDMIKKLNKYNYIRLTDNNFEQLLYILAEIKADLVENDIQKNYIVHINENLAALAGALPSSNSNDDSLYLIRYQKDDEEGYAIARDYMMNRMMVIDDDHLKLESYEFLHNAKYSIYKYNSKETFQIWGKCLADYSNKAFVRTKDYFYNKITGKQLLKEDQIEYDKAFEVITSIYDLNNATIDTIAANIQKDVMHPTLHFECVNPDAISKLPDFIKQNSNFRLMESVDGYFIQNIKNDLISVSHKDVRGIREYEVQLIL